MNRLSLIFQHQQLRKISFNRSRHHFIFAKCFNLLTHQRFFTSINGWFKNDSNVVSKAVLEAEKIIGYRTSYLSLRALLSDELTSIALHVKQLAASKHPLLTTARSLLFDSEHNVQARGIVVLLISKLLRQKLKYKKQIDISKTVRNQKSLAELTELIYVGMLIHRGIIDHRHMSDFNESKTKLEVGNKMSVLCGDFLFANSCLALSDLKNSKVVSYMSMAIGDMSQGCFVLPESNNFSVLTSKDELLCSVSKWKEAVYLTHASLLANACRSAAVLIEEESRYGDACAHFGENMVLAQQARSDIERMKGKVQSKVVPQSLELCTLPVVMAAQERGGKHWLQGFLLEDKPGQWVVRSDELNSFLIHSPSVFDAAEEVCRFHAQAAVDALNQLPAGEASSALRNLALALAT